LRLQKARSTISGKVLIGYYQIKKFPPISPRRYSGRNIKTAAVRAVRSETGPPPDGRDIIISRHAAVQGTAFISPVCDQKIGIARRQAMPIIFMFYG